MNNKTGLNHDPINDLVFSNISKSWNQAINSLANLMDIPVAIIFKKENDNIRVIFTNDNDKNPFSVNDTIPIKGSFCNYVFKNNDKFHVADYRDIDLDINNVATQADFVSYLGFPLKWPNGEYFGTICVLDDSTNYFSKGIEEFLMDFTQMLNDSLLLIDENFRKEREIETLSMKAQQHDMSIHTYKYSPMCRNCQRVKYNDNWINLNEFLAEYPEEVIKSMPSDWTLHSCN